MKILQINKFLYPKGGDAISMLNTGRLLAERGHAVEYWGMRHPANPVYPHSECFVDEVDYHGRLTLRQTLRQSGQLLYSLEAKAKVEAMVRATKPDIVHLHNFAHQLSPSILPVFRKHRLPVVMTMHDFKLVCPVYTLLAGGHFCQQCRQGRYYRCTLNKCAKGSYAKSLLNTVEMYLHHRFLHLYDLIDIYISPSRFMQRTMQEMGFRGEIQYLPNFINLNLYPAPTPSEQRAFVYFGRLDEGKGLETLLAAAQDIPAPLKIIGDGPLREKLEQVARPHGRIRFLGYLQGEALRREIRESLAVIQPSELNENNPLSVLEAFALGRPVIGSNMGGIPELVKDGETGLVYPAKEAGELKQRMLRLQADPQSAAAMGKSARGLIEREFSEETYYRGLMKLYQQAISKYS
ncbi:MAG: glycosyltransferase family 4 protein [Candidatus Firestonebacteria bacterium]|nr:glycosyltransferase family 4 protein [Candidatus Firestonebacteria bacterium]